MERNNAGEAYLAIVERRVPGIIFLSPKLAQ